MTPHELTARAAQYVTQAIARLAEAGEHMSIKPDGAGALVSLRANLESAKADLETVLAQPTT